MIKYLWYNKKDNLLAMITDKTMAGLNYNLFYSKKIEVTEAQLAEFENAKLVKRENGKNIIFKKEKQIIKKNLSKKIII